MHKAGGVSYAQGRIVSYAQGRIVSYAQGRIVSYAQGRILEWWAQILGCTTLDSPSGPGG